MARRLPDHLIDEIRSANDIVDVISERIQVRKAGRNYKAVCPFHDEKTPSFNINPERQIYHCFGCGVGGNVITFLMEYEKLDFLDAIRELAQRAGIALPERGAGQGDDSRDPVFEANEFAVSFFKERFRSPDGKRAREYWKGRGIGEDITDMFGIGCAPPGWDGLMEAAGRAGISPSVLNEAGLVIERESGGYYDRFRDRLIFPLLWTGGRAVGFGGRALDDSEPKYLNSPETRVYQKGRYLYGLVQARPSLRASREAVLVEGYMDLLSLYEAGFHNTVASAGTALTPEQARLISRYADRVFVAYDGDSAGVTAATRAAELLVGQGVKVRIVSLPEGSDPDAYVRGHGSDAMAERMAGALDFIDFFVSVRSPESPDDRESAARELLETVARIEDPIKSDLMVEKISDALGIGRGALTRALEARKAGETRRAAGRPAGKEKETPRRKTGGAELEAQKGLIGALLSGGEVGTRVAHEVAPEDFPDPELRRLAEIVLGALQNGDTPDAGALIDTVGEPAMAALVAEISVQPLDDENGGRACGDYIRILRKCAIEAEIRAVEREIETAEMTGDDEKLLRRVAARRELAERLRSLSAGD